MRSPPHATDRRTLALGLGCLALVGPLAPRPGRAATANTGGPSVRVSIRFDGAAMTARLEDNPSAADLASMLPLDLSIENYANNEKISYLPRKLTEAGAAPFGDERPGDLCYYAPWGNLALFYAGYRYSAGLIRLGRIEGSFEPLLRRGKFDLDLTKLD